MRMWPDIRRLKVSPSTSITSRNWIKFMGVRFVLHVLALVLSRAPSQRPPSKSLKYSCLKRTSTILYPHLLQSADAIQPQQLPIKFPTIQSPRRNPSHNLLSSIMSIHHPQYHAQTPRNSPMRPVCRPNLQHTHGTRLATPRMDST